MAGFRFAREAIVAGLLGASVAALALGRFIERDPSGSGDENDRLGFAVTAVLLCASAVATAVPLRRTRLALGLGLGTIALGIVTAAVAIDDLRFIWLSDEFEFFAFLTVLLALALLFGGTGVPLAPAAPLAGASPTFLGAVLASRARQVALALLVVFYALVLVLGTASARRG